MINHDITRLIMTNHHPIGRGQLILGAKTIGAALTLHVILTLSGGSIYDKIT